MDMCAVRASAQAPAKLRFACTEPACGLRGGLFEEMECKNRRSAQLFTPGPCRPAENPSEV